MLFTLFLIFITLKLAGLVAWSWWFVFAPLVVGFVLFSLGFIFGIGVLNGAEKAVLKRRRGW